mgnify:CR=1 FL=1
MSFLLSMKPTVWSMTHKCSRSIDQNRAFCSISYFKGRNILLNKMCNIYNSTQRNIEIKNIINTARYDTNKQKLNTDIDHLVEARANKQQCIIITVINSSIFVAGVAGIYKKLLIAKKSIIFCLACNNTIITSRKCFITLNYCTL